MEALIYEGKVVQIAEDRFDVHPSMSWVTIPENDSVDVGYWYDGTFVPPEIIPKFVPDSIFQKAVKRMVANFMLFINSQMAYINGTITKAELNSRHDELKSRYAVIKDAIEKINE